MSSIDRIHATTLSMNDRFTIMQKVGGGVSQRSRQIVRVPSTSASVRNRALLSHLEHNHTLRAALKIKRKRLGGAAGARIQTRNRLPVATTTATAIGANTVRRRLKRLNSVSKRLETLKADLLKKAKLQRNNSLANVSITDRLGVRGRPRLRRQPATAVRANSRARSSSRNRNNLKRTNSNQNLLQRSNSQSRKARGRSASRQRQNIPQRNRSRSRSRANANVNARAQQQPINNNQRRLIRRRSRSNLRKVTSVNDRLGVRGVGGGGKSNTNTQLNHVRRGRITKRRNSTVRNQIVNNGKQQAAGRSRSRTRQNGNQNVVRKRGGGGANGGKRQPRGQGKGQGQGQNGGGPQIRGRSRNVRASRPVKREAPKKSKEQLDQELEQYMVNTKTSLDRELAIYNN